ncbi:adenylate/guanylate cyclase domain-containing protein [Isoptericola sp. G70]|uniref:adenylate/guanylate cyclase domain-containing protein n=1 Tax=Isoptericola sp. G70 TaxID=3376633 RepID=UPI003A810B64
MATLKEQVDEAVEEVSKTWTKTTWLTTTTAVPDPDDMGYSDAKVVQATYLYSDLIDSSGLVKAADTHEEVASVMSTFLKVAVRIIRAENGHIRSFDGDRVMGVFTGANRKTRSVRAAMKIEYAVSRLIDPEIQSVFKSLQDAGWHIRAMTGIATSEALLVRAGIRNNSDLLSVGLGPNLAAKLSDLRDTLAGHHIAIGKGTYNGLGESVIMSKGKDMWTGPYSLSMGGGSYNYYTSNYRWTSL